MAEPKNAAFNMVVQKRIVVNGKTYHSVEEMPLDVRAQYEEAMSHKRKGVGVSFTHQGPTFTASITRASKTPAEVPGLVSNDPRPIEPASIESSLHKAMIMIVLGVAAIAAWVMLGHW
jgi:hypothetical protein